MGKLFFFCAPEFGHMNQAITIAKGVLDRSNNTHEVYFMIDPLWKNIMTKIDSRFKTLVMNKPPPPPTDDGREGVSVTHQLIELTLPYGNLDREGRNKLFAELLMKLVNFCSSIGPEMNRFVNEVKPNFIIVDHVGLQPNLINKGIPWTHLYSVTLNIFRHPKLPPPLVQCSSIKTETWPEKSREYLRIFGKVHERHAQWMTEQNVKPPPTGSFYYESPYFNVYMYPKELDYGVTDLPGEWYRTDAPLLYALKTDLSLPSEFNSLPGELIYMSMGSFLSLNVDLMQRLITILGKLKHKFIVSSGPKMQLMKFPPNVQGIPFVNQNNVLQHVRVMISHCGNNTLCECFYFGVRMVPLPVYGDQHDNAIRLHELGYSVAPLDPFTVNEQALSNALEETLKMSALTPIDAVSAKMRFETVIAKVETYLK